MFNVNFLFLSIILARIGAVAWEIPVIRSINVQTRKSQVTLILLEYFTERIWMTMYISQISIFFYDLVFVVERRGMLSWHAFNSPCQFKSTSTNKEIADLIKLGHCRISTDILATNNLLFETNERNTLFVNQPTKM